MTGTLFNAPRYTPVNSIGRPRAGAKLYFYRAGTSTAAPVYTTANLGTAHAVPVVATAGGEFPSVYLDPAAGYDYRAVLQTADGVQVWAEDNIPSALSAQSVGLALYPRTTAESAASVTPTNYQYPPGDVRRYGAVGDGSDATVAIQSAVKSGAAFIPKGTYRVSSPILLSDDSVVEGQGDASVLLVTSDIEVFYSATTTANTAINRVVLRDFFIQKTVSSATTKYDIHLQNPGNCLIQRVRIQSGHTDTSYSATNVGGIWLDRPAASTVTAFMNRVESCWIQNNSIYFRDITDSVINGGFVWGHTRQFAIRIASTATGRSGAIGIEKVVGIIASKYNGAIWLDGPGIGQIRIEGNEFDGNPLLDTGHGVYCPQALITCTISGNTFWGCDYHGIYAVDPVAWAITGNNFYKGNAGDNSYDDIRIESKTFQPNSNAITGNTFIIDEARSNKGYAYKEVDGGGGAPTQISFVGNSIYGTSGYQASPLLFIGSPIASGNGGAFTLSDRTSATHLFGTTTTGTGGENYCGISAVANSLVAGSGTLDLTINTTTFSGNPGGFIGTLAVSTTQTAAPTKSTRTLYSCVCRGTTSNFTSLETQDGSGGASGFTLSTPSAGVIRFTDTSAQTCAVSLMFSGSRSLA